MKVLGIWGSPRVGGNTEVLLDALLHGAREGGGEVEKVELRKLKISPCLEIYKCLETGECPIKDDMRDLYPKLLAADVVVLASPIFFYGVTAQAKAMIDRTQAFWARRYVLKNDFPGEQRQGVLLSTAATKGKHVFVGARTGDLLFFRCHQCPLCRGNPGPGSGRKRRHPPKAGGAGRGRGIGPPSGTGRTGRSRQGLSPGLTCLAAECCLGSRPCPAVTATTDRRGTNGPKTSTCGRC